MTSEKSCCTAVIVFSSVAPTPIETGLEPSLYVTLEPRRVRVAISTCVSVRGIVVAATAGAVIVVTPEVTL